MKKMSKNLKEHEDMNLHIKKSTFKALFWSILLAYFVWSTFYLCMKYIPEDLAFGWYYVGLIGGCIYLFFSPIILFAFIKFNS